MGVQACYIPLAPLTAQNMYDMDPNHVKKCEGEKNEVKGRLGEKRISASTLLLTALTIMGILGLIPTTPKPATHEKKVLCSAPSES